MQAYAQLLPTPPLFLNPAASRAAAPVPAAATLAQVWLLDTDVEPQPFLLLDAAFSNDIAVWSQSSLQLCTQLVTQKTFLSFPAAADHLINTSLTLPHHVSCFQVIHCINTSPPDQLANAYSSSSECPSPLQQAEERAPAGGPPPALPPAAPEGPFSTPEPPQHPPLAHIPVATPVQPAVGSGPVTDSQALCPPALQQANIAWGLPALSQADNQPQVLAQLLASITQGLYDSPGLNPSESEPLNSES